MMEFIQEENSDLVHAFGFNPDAVRTEMALSMPKPYHEHPRVEADLPAAFSLWLTTERASFLAVRYVECQWDVDELCGIRERVVAQGLLKRRVVFEHVQTCTE